MARATIFPARRRLVYAVSSAPVGADSPGDAARGLAAGFGANAAARVPAPTNWQQLAQGIGVQRRQVQRTFKGGVFRPKALAMILQQLAEAGGRE